MGFDFPGSAWQRVDARGAFAAAGLQRLTGVARTHRDIEKLVVPEIPKWSYEHRGDVTIDGSWSCVVDEHEPARTLHAIKGNVSVAGACGITNWGVRTPLYILGDLHAQRLCLVGDVSVFVGGDVVVEDLLYTSLTDWGTFAVGGTLSARLWLEAGGRGIIKASRRRGTKQLRNPDRDGKPNPVAATLARGYADDPFEVYRAIVIEGLEVLRPAWRAK